MTAEEVLTFWFQNDPALFRTDPWFRKSDAFDTEIRDRFALTVDAAKDGALDSWTATPQATIALLLVLDQFPRNIHRNSHLAFAGDAHARRIARAAIATGIEQHLTKVERCFLYLPFEHSEDLADQNESVRLFTAIADEPQLATLLDYAERHRIVIRRFARFPHRNKALGRSNTPAEEEYLAQPGSGF